MQECNYCILDLTWSQVCRSPYYNESGIDSVSIRLRPDYTCTSCILDPVAIELVLNANNFMVIRLRCVD